MKKEKPKKSGILVKEATLSNSEPFPKNGNPGEIWFNTKTSKLYIFMERLKERKVDIILDQDKGRDYYRDWIEIEGM